jgi:cathepsin L
MGRAVAEPVIEDHQLATYTYEQYMSDFGKAYSTPEEVAVHRARFEHSVRTVLSHNADKTKTWQLGINKFADMTVEEFKAYRGYNSGLAAERRKAGKISGPIEAGIIPDNFDWRTKGVVTAVKNQGQCGSCWAFATTEVTESQVAIATGKLLTLSPQNVVSCTPNPNHCGGTGGCNGATAELGMNYVQRYGIATEANWPYTATDGVCNTTGTHSPSATIAGYVQLNANDATSLLNAVASLCPIAVSVDASNWSLYKSGIYNGCNQVNPDIDHAVVLTGYGVDASSGNTQYWTVRNSWGTGWGEAGYIRLYRGPNETCGTDVTPQDGSACDGQTGPIQVCGTCGIWYDNSFPTGGSLM